MLRQIAEMLGTDPNTLGKSMFSGSTSTGAGIYITQMQLEWQFDVNIVNIFWALVTCVLMTLVSLFITDCYKSVRGKIRKRKEEKREERGIDGSI